MPNTPIELDDGPAKTPIYEYTFLSTEYSGGGDIEELVNKAAEEGWEYVETPHVSRWGSNQSFRATVVMRRLRQDR